MKLRKGISLFIFMMAVALLPLVFSCVSILNFGLAEDGDNKGVGLYVGKGSTLELENTTISGFHASSSNYAIHVAKGGTLVLNNVNINGNHEYGIYNAGEMHIYGNGIIDDAIYAESSFSIEATASVTSDIDLGDNAVITIEKYNGTLLLDCILFSNTRSAGKVLVLKCEDGYVPESIPSCFGSYSNELKLEMENTGENEYTVSLVYRPASFPNTWKDQIASTNYMTTTVDANSLTKIAFEKDVPTSYNQIGEIDGNIKVYQNPNDQTDIAFVHKALIAPADCSRLFYNLSNLKEITFNSFDTSDSYSFAWMFRDCSALESVDLQVFETSNVISLDSMFNGCSSLRSVNLSSFDTAKVENMGWMFNGCGVLTSMSFTFDTAKVTNMAAMFCGCASLPALNLNDGKFDTSNVTDMGSMFSGCRNLLYVDFGAKFSTANVKNMSYMFNDCSTLNGLFNMTFDTSKVTDMGAMFKNCSSLPSLNLRDDKFTTENVTTTSAMFEGCSSLQTLDLGNKFNTSKVTDMSCMFDGCTKLSTISYDTLTNCLKFNTSNVTTMAAMFRNCQSLSTLTIGGFDTRKVTNMDSMFNGCKSIKSLTLQFATTAVTNMGWMFYGCENLSFLDISWFDMRNVTSYDAMLYFGENNHIKTLRSPYNNKELPFVTASRMCYKGDPEDPRTSVERGTSSVYYYACIYLPRDWKNEIASSTYMSETISYSNIEWLEFLSSFPENSEVGDFDLIGTLSSGIEVYKDKRFFTNTYIFLYNGSIFAPEDCGFLFSDLTSLTAFDFDNFNTMAATNMKGMFKNCLNLSALIFKYNFNTSKVTDMSEMFRYCEKLEYVKFGTTFNTANVINMGWMFDNCKKLGYLTFETPFNTERVTEFSAMFLNCSSLIKTGDADSEVFDLSSFKTPSATNMGSMFYGCSSLVQIVFSENFDTRNVTNMAYMFDGCTSIKYLSLSMFDMQNVNSCGSMLNFGSNNEIQDFYTPINNKEILEINTKSILRLDGLMGESNKRTFVPANRRTSEHYCANTQIPNTMSIYNLKYINVIEFMGVLKIQEDDDDLELDYFILPDNKHNKKLVAIVNRVV